MKKELGTRFHISNGRIFSATSVFIFTLVAYYLLFRLYEIVLAIFIAIILASSIEPWVVALQRRNVPRSLAIILILLGAITFLIGLLALSIQPIAQLAMQFSSQESLIAQMELITGQLSRFSGEQFNLNLEQLSDLPQYLSGLLTQANTTIREQAWFYANTTIAGISQFLLMLVLAYYWLMAREQTLNLVLHLVPLRLHVETIWNDIEHTLGAYVRGQVILMVIIGFAATIGLLILGVPYAIALGVIAGFTEMIPMIGAVLGAVPAILLAFTVSPLTALLVAGWFLLIQSVEGNILVPKLMEKEVGLNPIIVIIALAAGFTLNGILGALIAVPLAGALQVLAYHLWISPTVRRLHQQPDQEGVSELTGDKSVDNTSVVLPSRPSSL